MKRFFTAQWYTWVSGSLLGIILAIWGFGFRDDGIAGVLTDIVYRLTTGAEAPPELVFSLMLMIGALVGGAVAAFGADKYRLVFLEEGASFSDRFGRSILFGFGGGFLVMLGSLVAGDVPWMHFAHAMQLSRPAWIFIAGMLIAGVFLAVLAGDKIGGGASSSAAAASGKDKKAEKKKTGGRK